MSGVTALWIAGEAVLILAGIVAVAALTADLLHAWPHIVALFTAKDIADDDA